MQSGNPTILEVRVLFGSIIETYPSTATRLASDASIVFNPEFESSLVKIQSGKSSELTSAELDAVKCLKQTPTGEIDPVESEPVDDFSFAARVLKRAKLNFTERYGYMNTRFLLLTSNICERLFAVTGNTLTNNRKRVLPASLEQQILLHINADLWGIHDVDEIVNAK